jgi:WD40 repeat protein
MLWDPTTGQLDREITDHTERVNVVAFSPCGQKLASASGDGLIILWEVLEISIPHESEDLVSRQLKRTNQSTKAEEFTSFPNMPAEIRLQIWGFAMPSRIWCIIGLRSSV